MKNNKIIPCFKMNHKLNKFKDSVNYIQKDGSVLIMFGNSEEHEDLCLFHVRDETILKDKIYPRFYLESCSDFEIKELYNMLFYNRSGFNRKDKIEVLSEVTVETYYDIISGLFLEHWQDDLPYDFVLSDENGRNLYIITIGVDTNEDFYYKMFS